MKTEFEHYEIKRNISPVKGMHITQTNRTASWRRYGDGCANINFTIGKYVSVNALAEEYSQLNIDITETAFADGVTKGSEKQVSVHIDEKTARALMVMLNDHFNN